MKAIEYKLGVLLERHRRAAALLLFLWTPLAPAQQSASTARESPGFSLSARYPAGAIKSLDTAERALSDVDMERRSIETRFANEEQACYPKFFATSCLEDAKERRRRALALVRPIEVEANQFKRSSRVQERERGLAERRAQAQSKALQISNEPQETEHVGAARAPDGGPEAMPGVKLPAVPKGAAAARLERHNAPRKDLPAGSAVEAKKRADNIDAFHKKRMESEARQRDIAAKKAEKERERADKDAASAKP